MNSAGVKCKPTFICRYYVISVGRHVVRITWELSCWRSVSPPWQCSCTCHSVQESVILHPPHSPDTELKVFYFNKTQVVTEGNEISWDQQNSRTVMGYTCRILKDSRCFQKWCHQWAHCYKLQRDYFGGVSMESHVNVLITGGKKNIASSFWSHCASEAQLEKQRCVNMKHFLWDTWSVPQLLLMYGCSR